MLVCNVSLKLQHARVPLEDQSHILHQSTFSEQSGLQNPPLFFSVEETVVFRTRTGVTVPLRRNVVFRTVLLPDMMTVGATFRTVLPAWIQTP